jgi:hypothetical protein
LHRTSDTTKIAEYEVKVHSTKDKKKLKEGMKEYEYGTINIRDPKLTDYIGDIVTVKVEDIRSNTKINRGGKLNK